MCVALQIRKKSAYFFVLILMGIIFQTNAFAGRSVGMNLPVSNAAYFNLRNLSSIPQTVSVIFAATGPVTITATGCTGHLAMTCSSNKLCNLATAYQTLPPKSAVSFCVEFQGYTNNGNLAPHSGVSLLISTVEDRGALQSTGLALVAGSYSSLSPNAGRPF